MKSHRSIVLCLALLAPLTPAFAQITFSFGSPGAHVGITLNAYPTLQRIPGYPVYYAPSMRSNYFFYDGLYWLLEGDGWYASSWYNGPWYSVEPWDVPVYVLRVPVRYYRYPPSYFHGWNRDQPPRWGDHYGSSFEQRRGGWDRWDRHAAPPPAPLPTYQRQYSGTRYPDAQQQATILTQKYRYQPQDPVATQHFQQQRAHVQPQPQARQHESQGHGKVKNAPEHDNKESKGKGKGQD